MTTSRRSSMKDKRTGTTAQPASSDPKRLFPHAEEDAKAFAQYTRRGILPPGLRSDTLRFPVPPTPEELKAIRRKAQLSQSQLANLINTPKKTYQNWEQGLRKPDGTVTLLLQLLQEFPEVKGMLVKVWSGVK